MKAATLHDGEQTLYTMMQDMLTGRGANAPVPWETAVDILLRLEDETVNESSSAILLTGPCAAEGASHYI